MWPSVGQLVVRRGMKFTAAIVVFGLLLLAGCSSSRESASERCARVRRPEGERLNPPGKERLGQRSANVIRREEFYRPAGGVRDPWCRSQLIHAPKIIVTLDGRSSLSTSN